MCVCARVCLLEHDLKPTELIGLIFWVVMAKISERKPTHIPVCIFYFSFSKWGHGGGIGRGRVVGLKVVWREW